MCLAGVAAWSWGSAFFVETDFPGQFRRGAWIGKR